VERARSEPEAAATERVAPLSAASAHPLLQLQRTAGNRAVARLVAERAVARDGRAPTDTAPVDDVDRAAGGRARTNRLYGRQCEPYASRTGAQLVQIETLLRVQTAVGLALATEPAVGDVLAEWRKYLNGTGGMSTHDLTSNPGDLIAQAFQRDNRHEPAEDAIFRHAWSRRADWLPRLAGPGVLTLSFDDLAVPQSLRRPVPDYDNNAFTVAANLAGGVGDGVTPDSDFGPDYRDLGGTITVTNSPDRDNRMWSRIFMSGDFVWTIHDSIDFCPGNAGNTLQESLTIPMSRLEASGLAKDVGLLVKFPRHRTDTPQVHPNPAIQP
jgi:hypothetical protein